MGKQYDKKFKESTSKYYFKKLSIWNYRYGR